MATGPQYRVDVLPPARKQLLSFPQEDRDRILRALTALATDPRPRGCKKLQGVADQYRIRVGSYRIIYAIVDDRLIVLVLRIGPRGNIYRKKK